MENFFKREGVRERERKERERKECVVSVCYVKSEKRSSREKKSKTSYDLYEKEKELFRCHWTSTIHIFERERKGLVHN